MLKVRAHSDNETKKYHQDEAEENSSQDLDCGEEVCDVPGCLKDRESMRHEWRNLIEGEVDLFGIGDTHLITFVDDQNLCSILI